MKPGPRHDGLLFRALPDSRIAHVAVGLGGVPYLTMPNCLMLHGDVDGAVGTAYQEWWHPAPGFPARAKRVINACANADEYASALHDLDAAMTPQVPVFNHPRAVVLARRDMAGAVLNGIPGIEVPRTLRFSADRPQDMMRAFQTGQFAYPVTVEPCTLRNGQGRVRVDHPMDWQRAMRARQVGRHHLMVQARADDARFPWRIRMTLLGQEGAVEMYRAAGTGTASDLPPALSRQDLTRLFQVLRRRLPLDFWTLDLALRGPTHLVLTEVNPGLIAVDPTSAEGDLRAATQRNIERLLPALARVLMTPAHWRHDAWTLRPLAEPVARDAG